MTNQHDRASVSPAEEERSRKLALEAQGEIQPIIGMLDANPDNLTTDEIVERLRVAHDFIRRIVDGDNYAERWAAVESGKPDPGYQPASASEPIPQERCGGSGWIPRKDESGPGGIGLPCPGCEDCEPVSKATPQESNERKSPEPLIAADEMKGTFASGGGMKARTVAVIVPRKRAIHRPSGQTVEVLAEGAGGMVKVRYPAPSGAERFVARAQLDFLATNRT